MSDPIIPVGWFEGLVGVIMAGLTGWIARLESKAGRAHDKINQIEVDLARNYHTKTELKEAINDSLSPIVKELDRLARAIEKLSED